jgi:hypothetical protein
MRSRLRIRHRTPTRSPDRIFEDFCLDAHIPGLVYGIVVDGRLIHVGTVGAGSRLKSARSRVTPCSASRR